MSNRDWGKFAHEKALEIFLASQECLMAHSIRAVEKHIQQCRFTPASVGYSIRLFVRKRFAAEVRTQAKAFIQEHRADIVVDADIGIEYQRRAIAHELGHILLAMYRYRQGETLARQSSQLIEDACDIFERDLCKRHHNYYCDPANDHKFLFPSLDGHIVGPSA